MLIEGTQGGKKLDIRRIRYFITVCETLNFSEAARRLGLSQPALSKAIQKLEDELGGTLIRREGVKTHLTHLGRLMHDQFQKIDEATQQAELTAKRLVNGDMPQIQIAVMCTIGPNRFGAFLKQWQSQNPEVEIVLRDASRDRIGDMLLSGYVDCALVGAMLSNEPRFKYTELYQEDMVVAFSPDHHFAGAERIDLGEVMQEPYLDRLNCEFRGTFISESERMGSQVEFVARSEREDWIQTLVRAGLGVTILPIGSIMVEGLETRPISDESLKRTVSLAVPFGREDTVHLRSLLSAMRRCNWKAT